jgi:hypothetical protein
MSVGLRTLVAAQQHLNAVHSESVSGKVGGKVAAYRDQPKDKRLVRYEQSLTLISYPVRFAGFTLVPDKGSTE